MGRSELDKAFEMAIDGALSSDSIAVWKRSLKFINALEYQDTTNRYLMGAKGVLLLRLQRYDEAVRVWQEYWNIAIHSEEFLNIASLEAISSETVEKCSIRFS